MDDIAISVKNIDVTYKSINAYSVKQSLFRLKKVETKIIHAISNVSFDVKKGEILGIVGKNGSGKSTLLSAIAGVFSQDRGEINLYNNSISLLSLGAGFRTDITGRENILLNGMLLGFSEKEVRDKMPQIIEFADIGKFIDMPVRTYSSGMKSKLQFAVTVTLETDIMLVDEVLSVGDTKFRKKSYNKMLDLITNEKRTALIVSHQEETLRNLCDRILWLDAGKIKMLGETEEVLDKYIAEMH